VVKTVSKQNILELTHEKARNYFLKSESYCNFDLPVYFNFTCLLSEVDLVLKGKKLSDFENSKPQDLDDVNYKILNNKDGRYAWRPLQLIHPALYVSLAHEITTQKNWTLICERFNNFSSNSNIECLSIPKESSTKNSDKAEQISSWWKQIEQRSIEMALDYQYLTHTDITDCYGAIYTHSVAWALHDKKFIKEKNNKYDNSLLGNKIDTCLSNMSHGQTNGIPQGSSLMDFIAEIVLGYADLLLSDEIGEKIKDYKILRYRDDYRIFTNNLRDGEQILKYLTEVMISLGLKLNAEKTNSTNDVVTGAIKNDKLYWIKQKQTKVNFQKDLLIIYELSRQYSNSGSLKRALDDFYSRLLKVKNFKENIIPLISIASDIAYKNPVTYNYIAAIVSYLLSYITDDSQKKDLLKRIIKKFSSIPNTGHLMIWLQRIYLGISLKSCCLRFDEKICCLVLNENVELWNNSWLKGKIKDVIKPKKIIDHDEIEKLPAVISRKEVELFKSNHNSSD
jgi:RNA-directed DNA polymerase